jgi:hypothetical protein
MAAHKVIRSNPPAQPQPQHAKRAHAAQRRPDHQLKAEIFETLRHLNRGYGVALAALDRLETKDRQRAPRAFSSGFVQDYRNRTEALRSLANWDLLRMIADREEHDAERFGRLCDKTKRRAPSRRS